MTSEKILSVHHALGELAGRVPDLEWALVRLCRENLLDCADQVDNLEKELEVPGCQGRGCGPIDNPITTMNGVLTIWAREAEKSEKKEAAC